MPDAREQIQQKGLYSSETVFGDLRVEVRTFVSGFVGLRPAESADPYLVMSPSEFRSLLFRIKRGEIDYLGERAGPHTARSARPGAPR
jgi:hypothetical protein